jgi:predicted short-subunit dehydrogenase-like oxidoreductase (DUF2520 family)
MQITLLGSGNVATTIGQLCRKAGHDIVQVYGRNPVTTQNLAKTLGAEPAFTWDSIQHHADIYIAALPDTIIPALHLHLNLSKGMVVHTAGAVPMLALAGVARNFGVLYPLQSLKAEETPPAHVPFLVDGNTPEDKTLLLDFAGTLSPKVAFANDVQRLNLHLAAVWVNNFTNYLFTEAWEICQEKGVDFNMLLPLMEHTVERLKTYPPSSMQTGPALRGDLITIEKHLELLDNRPEAAALYRLLSDAIAGYHGKVSQKK